MKEEKIMDWIKAEDGIKFTAATELEKRYGKSIEAILLDIIYNEDALDADRIEAARLFYDLAFLETD
jgi:hypothetical protein